MKDSSLLYDLVGIGRSYVDVIASVPYAFLECHDIPLDSSRYFDPEGIQGVLSRLDGAQVYAGGAIPNTLSGLAAFGGRTAYFGKVGDDELGRTFLDDLGARGIVDLGSNPVKGSLSGTCAVLLTEGGERSFALHEGCVDRFDAIDFDSFDFATTHTLLFSANLLAESEHAPDVLASVLKKASRAPCRIAASLSEVRAWQGRDAYASNVLVPFADIIVGNEREVEALRSVKGLALDDKEQILLVTTLGARGSMARYMGKTFFCPSSAVDGPISSVGAGDQFLAGFLMGQVRGMGIEDSLALGTHCAVAILGQSEARPLVGVSWEGLLAT